jgi:hypothetical protein
VSQSCFASVYLVRESQGDPNDEKKERHDEIGHCYAVPWGVVHRRKECSSVIDDDHKLHQRKNNI